MNLNKVPYNVNLTSEDAGFFSIYNFKITIQTSFHNLFVHFDMPAHVPRVLNDSLGVNMGYNNKNPNA